MSRASASRVRLHTWGLDAARQAGEQLEKIILKAAQEALQTAMRDPETHAYMLVADHEPSPDVKPRRGDPLEIHFSIALGAGLGYEDPVYKTSLRKILEPDIRECSATGDWAGGLAKIRNHLRLLADDIDRAIQRGTSKTP